MATTKYPNGIEGPLTGNVTGNITGNVDGDFQITITAMTANGAISVKQGVVHLDKAGVLAATLADPVDVTDDGKILTIIAKTAQAHTVTIAGGLNGGGAGADVGTFGGAIADQFSVVAIGGKWWKYGAPVNVTFA